MRVLVAGATGNLGREVVKAGLARGWDVVALARHPKELPERRDPRVTLVKADVTKPRTLAGVCDGVDAVVSAVGLVGVSALKAPVTHDELDHQGNANLLREAERANVGKFAYASMLHAHSDPTVALLRAKRAMELELQRSSVPWLIVRPTAYFQTVAQGILDPARRAGVVVLAGTGESRVAPVHPADVAEWLADHLHETGVVQPLGGPDEFTWNGVADLAFSVLGKRPRVVHAPAQALTVGAFLARPFRGGASGELEFLRFALTTDLVAPPAGKHALAPWLEDAARGR